MSQRSEFVRLAEKEGANIAELCRRFGISRKTGYKWLERFRSEGELGLADRSRRPRCSPGRTPDELARAILRVRRQHPAWGGRKIKAYLHGAGWVEVPAASTITAILQRHGLIDPEESAKHRPGQRFEAAAANELWQMDFKGHFPAARGRCHPLTVLDDYSRYALGLEACGDESEATVRRRLTDIFRRYGLPRRLLVDNGAPWGSDSSHQHTRLTVWLLRLGVKVIHARPYHPQTLGKDERFHRTLKAEVLGSCIGLDLPSCQTKFDSWRRISNLERPHEALEMAPPIKRYQPSGWPFPEQLPPIEYSPEDKVRKVDVNGRIFYRNRRYRLGKAFIGEYVALRPTQVDGVLDVFYLYHKIRQLHLYEPED